MKTANEIMRDSYLSAAKQIFDARKGSSELFKII